MSIVSFAKAEWSETLSYPMAKVVESVKFICEIGKGKYTLSERNDILRTYKVVIRDVVLIIPLDITLLQKDANATECKIVVYDVGASESVQINVNAVVSYFMQLMEKRLKGEAIRKKEVTNPASTKWGCVWTVVIAIIINVGLIILL